MDSLKLCQTIALAIKNQLHDDVKQQGFTGETMDDHSNLKSVHEIDKITAKIATTILEQYNCNIFIESVNDVIHDDAEFSIYIDPIDGSLNWERGVGDPCIVIALSSKSKINCLNDLNFSYVEGLRSNDVYYSDLKNAYFISGISNKLITIKATGVQHASQAVAYLRTGYSAAPQQLQYCKNLYPVVRDIRGFDNAAMELCEIARNAADVMVEARGISDFYNLLAYPILKTAGGYLTDLQGNDIGQQHLEFNAHYNYIACNNKQLLTSVITLLP